MLINYLVVGLLIGASAGQITDDRDLNPSSSESKQSEENIEDVKDFGTPPLPCIPRPKCACTNIKYYEPDGRCNNPEDGSIGQAGRPFKRLVPAAYADGKGAPRGQSSKNYLPSSRVVSTTMQEDETPKSNDNTQMFTFWGQHLAHDFAFTPNFGEGTGIDCSCGSNSPACFQIKIPEGDIQRTKGNKLCFPFFRSTSGLDADCNSFVREQVNILTPYIDSGTLYGANQQQLDELLHPTSSIGLMKVGSFSVGSFRSSFIQPTLPLQSRVKEEILHSICPAIHRPPQLPCFAAGDVRANEQPGLASLHIIFLRMHNNIVTTLSRINSRWSREKLINTVRLIISAITQRITYDEFLPELFEMKILERFQLQLRSEGYWYGYNSAYHATLSNAFATAALRFGHTLVTSPLSRPNFHFSGNQGAPLNLKDSFFDTTPLLSRTTGSAATVLMGLSVDAAEPVDPVFIDDLHNFLFRSPGKFGGDLLSFNIQRGRDHGLPGYNTYREFCGLKKVTLTDPGDFPTKRHEKLLKLYRNRLDDVDLYIGMVAESPRAGSLLGPTFSCLLAYQFRDIKKGDRLWHENKGVFTPEQVQEIRKYRLSNLLCEQLRGLKTMQPNPFQLPIGDNIRKTCRSYGKLDLNKWKESPTPQSSGMSSCHRPIDFDHTAWFPTTYRDDKFPNRPYTLYEHILNDAPELVCEDLKGVEKRTVRGVPQFRYQCLPGSIEDTDFPNVDASKGKFTPWKHPSRSTSGQTLKPPPSCKRPIAIQVQSTSGVPARETKEVYRQKSAKFGFQCHVDDQPNRRCGPKIIRFFCA